MESGKHLDLEKHIFGGGSDLSESDSDRDLPKKRSKSRQRTSEPLSSAGEEYVRDKSVGKKKRRPRTNAVDGNDAPKRKRKKKEKPLDDGVDRAEVPLTAEEERRMRLDQSIKDILKGAKRPRKKKNEDDLDKIADDFVSALRAEMLLAAEDDKRAHADGLPALAKLKMLDRVMDVLQKRQYSTSVMDQDLLGACKIWLEPLDAKSLPAHNIQKAFFEHFVKMNIDTETLRESGLGRIVLFYTKCKRVSEPIRRIASQLVDTWTRPILKRSASYRDKIIPIAGAEEMQDAKVSVPKLSAILQRAKLEDERRFGRESTDPTTGAVTGGPRRGVRVPERQFMEFKVAPRVSSSLLGRNPLDDALASRRMGKEMLKRLQKKEGGRGG